MRLIPNWADAFSTLRISVSTMVNWILAHKSLIWCVM
jgi:hypothetical protein